MFSKVRFILRQNILGKNINQSYKFLIGNNNNYLRDSVANNLIYLSQKKQKNKKNYSFLFIVPCFIISLIVWNG